MNRPLLFLFALCVGGGFVLQVQAQIDDCEAQLNRATEEFNAGHFSAIAAILKPCIDQGFSREQRQRAYLLLTQTYLLMDDPIGAESSYLELLLANPEFEADPIRDPIDVVYLSKRFTAAPIFSLFGRLGINLSPVHLIQAVNITGDQVQNKYTLRPGWLADVGLEWHPYEKISFRVELQYAHTTYKRTQSGLFENTSRTELIDRQNWGNIPISIKYTHYQGALSPYAYIGYAVNILFSDKASLTLTDEQPLNITESPVLNYSPRRNVFNRSLLTGIGIQYKFSLDYIFVDIQYAWGQTNLFNYEEAYFDYDKHAGPDYVSESLLASGEPAFRFASVDNFFRLNNLCFSVGYIHPLYKPRKLRKARTKSILRSIRKQAK